MTDTLVDQLTALRDQSQAETDRLARAVQALSPESAQPRRRKTGTRRPITDAHRAALRKGQKRRRRREQASKRGD